MSPKFCHNCGKPASAGWKACPFCETSFASLSEVPKSQKIAPLQRIQPQQPTVTLVGRDEDGEDDMYLDHQDHYRPQIEALAVEVTVPRDNGKDTIGNLATNPFANVSTEIRTPPQSLTAEQAIQQFAQEAGKPAERLK